MKPIQPRKIIATLFTFVVALVLPETMRAEGKGESVEEREGQVIATQLRSSAPEKASEIRGWIRTESKHQRLTNETPVICSIVPSKDYWEAIYELASTSGRPAEKLVVRHFPDKANEYYAARAQTSQGVLPKPQLLKSTEATIPVAGSDFWLTDLGLDFLHWPTQRRIKDPKNSMRLGRSCYILESINPAGKQIVRVKSWIDRESADAGAPGILVAEAYDAKDKRIKVFTLSGSSFKKVDGQRQLEKMTIENIPNKSETVLRFDLSKPHQP